MDINLQNLLIYYEKCILRVNGPKVLIHVSAIQTTLEFLNKYNRLTSVKDKDSSNHLDNRKKLKNLYNIRYQQKAQELSGKSINADGKPILPRWDAKAHVLLKADYFESGYRSMIRYIELFFSDEVDSVSNFTSKINKAGYAYNIFHLMIPKLAMYPKEPTIPCIHCGLRGKHNKNCPEAKKILCAITASEEEKNALKEELKNISAQEIYDNLINNRRKQCHKQTS